MDKMLQQFLEVATLKNVSHAAKKLCLSQPALTHNMKKLEESFGVQLFIRTSNGVKLTAFGGLLLEQARIIRRIYDNTHTKITAMKERYEHGLQIGSGHAWWYLFLRDVVGGYRQRHPSADLSIDIGNHLREMDLLLSGDISLFLGHEIVGLNRRAGVIFRPLFQTYDGFFVRQGHPLLGKPCSLADVFQYPMIDLTPDEDRYAHVIEDPRSKQAERINYHLNERVIYRSNSIMSCIDLILNSDGVHSFTASMAGYYRAHGIVPLDLAGEHNWGRVGIYLTEEACEDLRIQEVLSLIDERVESILRTSARGVAGI
jgi:DNA-binding transcriptional LysR family regulator